MKIYYRPRQAGTATYWDMNPRDLEWIRQQLIRLMVEVMERTPSQDQLDRNLVEVWFTPNPDLGRSPKYREVNTMAAVVGGILKNFSTGTRDLTDRNCEKIAEVMRIIDAGAQKRLLPDLKISPAVFEATQDQTQNQFNHLFR